MGRVEKPGYCTSTAVHVFPHPAGKVAGGSQFANPHTCFKYVNFNHEFRRFVFHNYIDFWPGRECSSRTVDGGVKAKVLRRHELI